MRVLIVDDSSIIRQRLAERLEEVPGVEIVGEAENGVQALELIRSVRPHFLTLDLRMPGGSGLELLHELRQMPSAPLVAVVTNYATPEYRSRCRELGALAFLDKSRQIDELILLVEELRSEGRSEEPSE